MKYSYKGKGFTLVELLIVLVIIGILGAMMMISSSEAVSSAKATTIISDLRAVKAAALSYYTDHSDKTSWNAEDLDQKNLFPYLKKTNDETVDDAAISLNGYKVVINSWEDWYAQCDLNAVLGVSASNKDNTQLKAILRKLGDKSKSAGISFSNEDNAKGSRKLQIKDGETYKYVYMWIR